MNVIHGRGRDGGSFASAGGVFPIKFPNGAFSERAFLRAGRTAGFPEILSDSPAAETPFRHGTGLSVRGNGVSPRVRTVRDNAR